MNIRRNHLFFGIVLVGTLFLAPVHAHDERDARESHASQQYKHEGARHHRHRDRVEIIVNRYPPHHEFRRHKVYTYYGAPIKRYRNCRSSTMQR